MIHKTEEPTRDEISEPLLGGYRLAPSPRRLEGGSLLFSATTADGSRASVQVSAEPVTSRRTRARFRRLVRTRAALKHPALLEVRGTGEEGGRLYVATEPFPARSLAALVREGATGPREAVRLLGQVAAGLDAAHAEGLIHRTLSADSVLIDGEQAKLDLFGLFTVAGQPSWGDVVRKDAHLHYDSPEAVRGEELTAASNVYSLTGLLVHVLTGQEPFVNHDPVMITYAHVSQPPPKVSERRPELPAALDAVVARGMAKEPDERPESAGALIAAAKMALRVPEPAPRAPQPAPRPARSEPARPRPAAPEKADAVSDVAARVAAHVGAPRKPAAGPATPAAALGKGAAAPVKRAIAPGTPAAVGAAAASPASSASAAPAKAPQAGPPRPATAGATARPRVSLAERLVRFGPMLGVIALAAIFGVLLGMPSGGSEQAAQGVPSANQRAVMRLDEVRFRLRDELALATTPDEQAHLAGRLAIAYGRAADHASSSELVSAAHEASSAYTNLQTAARSGDAAAYDTARGEVEAAESAVSDELAQIGAKAPRE
jgi:Protein kinase domain